MRQIGRRIILRDPGVDEDKIREMLGKFVEEYRRPPPVVLIKPGGAEMLFPADTPETEIASWLFGFGLKHHPD